MEVESLGELAERLIENLFGRRHGEAQLDARARRLQAPTFLEIQSSVVRDHRWPCGIS